MPSRNRSGAALASALFVALAPASAAAFRCKVSDTNTLVPLRWAEREVVWGMRLGAELDEETAERAFAAWTEQPCTDLRLSSVGLVPADAAINQVALVQAGWLEAGRPREAVAVTITTFGRDSGLIRAAHIEVNGALYRFGDTERVCDPGTYDLGAVLTHEVGHFIGLDHTEVYLGEPGDPTMAPVVGACEADKRVLKGDDVAGLCHLYPAGAPPGPCTFLPDQARPYVTSQPFGCSASPAGDPLPLLELGLGLSGALWGRWRGRRRRARAP